MKPVRGGSPAKDKIANMSKAVKVGAFVQAKARALILVVESSFSATNTVEVIKM